MTAAAMISLGCDGSRPWVEFAIFTSYAVLAVVIGAITFRRRDA